MSGEILVFSEDAELRSQLVGRACRLASDIGWGCVAYALYDEPVPRPPGPGSHPEPFPPPPAAQPVPDACVAALAAAVSHSSPRVILIGATKLGMEIAPRLAERSDAGYAPWTLDFGVRSPDGPVTATCMLYAGTGTAEYEFTSDCVVATIAPGVFPDDRTSANDVPLRRLSPIGDSSVRVLRLAPKPMSHGDVEHSRLVVDCGKGVSTPEHLELARSLATLLDGQVACSRPLASERHWFSQWLGLSGVRTRPEFCLALGISGSVQHLIGIRDARVIAAVNHDEEAAIFGQSDLGLVTDVGAFLPAFIERLVERGVSPAWRSAQETGRR